MQRMSYTKDISCNIFSLLISRKHYLLYANIYFNRSYRDDYNQEFLLFSPFHQFHILKQMIYQHVSFLHHEDHHAVA